MKRYVYSPSYETPWSRASDWAPIMRPRRLDQRLNWTSGRLGLAANEDEQPARSGLRVEGLHGRVEASTGRLDVLQHQRASTFSVAAGDRGDHPFMLR